MLKPLSFRGPKNGIIHVNASQIAIHIATLLFYNKSVFFSETLQSINQMYTKKMVQRMG